MSDGTQQFSVSDIEYNLITTLSNLLQSEEVLVKYAEDADRAGDSDCATLFRSLRENNKLSAQEFRRALDRHMHEGK
ncbi:MAG: hypothetical protein H0W06_13475 [Chloroflexia bacterium]|nr:hypothetical protein [Chloroflexia bacterium]